VADVKINTADIGTLATKRQVVGVADVVLKVGIEKTTATINTNTVAGPHGKFGLAEKSAAASAQIQNVLTGLELSKPNRNITFNRRFDSRSVVLTNHRLIESLKTR
jgi:hypothetical protein